MGVMKQLFLGLLIVYVGSNVGASVRAGFVQTKGNQFVLNGRKFNFNGFNAYWMMVAASGATNQKAMVPAVLKQASRHGLTVGRTWAFSDGGAFPLQTAPGVYNEAMFKALDSVVAEAGKNGIRLIMGLVNNYADFGGRRQYVQWAKERGHKVGSDDDFYTNKVVKGYYKNHIKTVLTRRNTITGVAYKEDPTIFAWELINEPRCQSDLSGKTFQAWVAEMASYVKSIDRNHLVEIGAEGFYGPSTPAKNQLNPHGITYGTDFVANNQVKGIDFATIHAYPDQWLLNSKEKAQEDYLRKWAQAHIEDTAQLIKKPLVITEFGKSLKGATAGQRDAFFGVAYDAIYSSARAGGPLRGGLFWQLLGQGMDNANDGYQIVFPTSPSTANVILKQSTRRMLQLNH